jgi:hypothetical protein
VISLNKFPKKHSYSMLETRLFQLLPQNGRPVGSKDLLAAYEKNGEWNVAHPLNIITVTMGILIKKVKANKEPFVIEKEGRYIGHPEVEYWIKKRNGK